MCIINSDNGSFGESIFIYSLPFVIACRSHPTSQRSDEINKGRIAVIGFIMVLLVYTFAVNAATLDSPTARLPWKNERVNGVTSGATNVSTAFGADGNFPMLSWNEGQIIYHAYPLSPPHIGNCGPDDTWKCYGISAQAGNNVVAGTVSNMSSEHLINTFLVDWAYKTDTNKIQGVQYEYSDAGDYLTRVWVDLIDLDKFGSPVEVVGAPSMKIIDGRFRLAVTLVLTGGDFPVYRLVYLHWVGGSNTSCLTAGSGYQCDVLETSISEIGAPSLDWVAIDSVGIAYTKDGEGLKYAYPHTNSESWPANCGPAPQAWRCIPIYGAAGTVGKEVKFHFGNNQLVRGIAFTYDDAMIEKTLYVAEYLGSGGNCGADKNDAGIMINKWKCSDVDLLTYIAAPSFSIAVDPQGYPLIAYNNALSDLSPVQLYLAYPKARIGVADPGWNREKIDGAPKTSFRTGAKAALSINKAGLGMIGYLQEDYQLPDVKVAHQFFTTYLPAIKK